MSCWATGFCPSLEQTAEYRNPSCFWSIVAGPYVGMQIEVCRSICSQPYWTNHPTTIAMRGQERIHRKWLQQKRKKLPLTPFGWASAIEKLCCQCRWLLLKPLKVAKGLHLLNMRWNLDFQPTRFAASLSAKLNPRVAARMQLCVSSRLRKIKLRSFRPK